MKKNNKFLQNIAELLEASLVSSSSFKKEGENILKFNIEKIINKLNLVRREEFEIQKELLEKMSKEINQVKRNVIKKRKKRFSKKGKKF